MCGRFALFSSGEEVAERLQLAETPLLEPRYNIAPTQAVAVVRAADAGRRLDRLRWGLVPSWAKDTTIGNKLLNARAETVDSKPSFRSAFKQRRCLIPASGFYEWQKAGSGRKQPFFIHPRDGSLFVLAGLWERWHDAEGKPLETCTILTTGANELMQSLHDRMPVLLDEAGTNVWLDPSASKEALQALFVPFAAAGMEANPVGPWVSNPRNEGIRCLEPVNGSS